MGPLSTWLLIAAVAGFLYLLLFALMRAASRASLMEERILRRIHPRVHHLDDGKLALAMRRAGDEPPEAA